MSVRKKKKKERLSFSILHLQDLDQNLKKKKTVCTGIVHLSGNKETKRALYRQQGVRLYPGAKAHHIGEFPASLRPCHTLPFNAFRLPPCTIYSDGVRLRKNTIFIFCNIHKL